MPEMTKAEQFAAKKALQILTEAGGAGVSKDVLLEMVGLTTERPLTTAEGDALIDLLMARGWAVNYRDPITGCTRYVISGPGTLAKGAL